MRQASVLLRIFLKSGTASVKRPLTYLGLAIRSWPRATGMNLALNKGGFVDAIYPADVVALYPINAERQQISPYVAGVSAFIGYVLERFMVLCLAHQRAWQGAERCPAFIAPTNHGIPRVAG